MATTALFLTDLYAGYYHRQVPEEDHDITHVGPGTPCGEWMRGYWIPVAYSADLKDLPKRIRILGEDLVVFRDKQGKLGLLELHCSLRGTSLEFGMIGEHGIRCCYHGWYIDVDGRILETPGEPQDSTLKERLFHGAYPTQELHGMMLAYMGLWKSNPHCLSKTLSISLTSPAPYWSHISFLVTGYRSKKTAWTPPFSNSSIQRLAECSSKRT